MTRWIAIAAVGVLVLLGAWTIVDWFIDGTDDAYVATDGQPWRCTGTDVEMRPDDGEDDTFLTPSVFMRPGMDCKLRFFVRNDGADAVTIATIEAPLNFGTSGPGAEATHLNPTYGSAEGPVEGEFGRTRWVVNDRINSGEEQYYEFWIEFRESGCSEEGSRLSFSEWPTIITDSGDQLRTEAVPIGFIGTADTNCGG